MEPLQLKTFRQTDPAIRAAARNRFSFPVSALRIPEIYVGYDIGRKVACLAVVLDMK
jgi:hypothetical protein